MGSGLMKASESGNLFPAKQLMVNYLAGNKFPDYTMPSLHLLLPTLLILHRTVRWN
jgi:hypothetical protein